MPVRNPVNRYGRNIVGKFPSLKLKRMVVYESSIERDQIYLMEYDPNVVFYEEQPFVIDYEADGKQLTYTPDFRVVERSGRHLLVECKPQEYVTTEKNLRKFAAAEAWCVGQNWTFKVVTEQETRSGFRLENVMMLWQFARHQVSLNIKARIYDVLNSANRLTLDDLATCLDPYNPTSATVPILCLIYHHELSTNIDEAKITGNSPIYLSQTIGVRS